MSAIDLLGLGSALADVFTYLDPKDQCTLRGTTKQMTAWYDVAAENGSVPFSSHTAGQTWKYSPVHPKTGEHPDTVTANVRNYYFSTMNTYSNTNTAVKAPTLEGNDEFVATDVVVHKFILQGFKAKTLFVTGLNGIKSIDDRFLEKCTAETIVFVDGANQLEAVGKHFMLRCMNLKTVEFRGAFPKLQTVEQCFMAECEKLETVDFTGLTALRAVHDRWFFNDKSLANVDFAPFAGTLQKVGCCFLGHVTKVDNLDAKLAILTKVTEVNTVGQFAPPALRAFARGKEPKTDSTA